MPERFLGDCLLKADQCDLFFAINITRNTCIAETREARGVGEAHKMSGMEGGRKSE